MPTREILARFWKDFDALTADQQAAFIAAVEQFVEDLKGGEGFRNGLRVKGVRGHPGIFEMTWAANGRATFQYATSPRPGDTHIIWRRIGTHSILKNP